MDSSHKNIPPSAIAPAEWYALWQNVSKKSQKILTDMAKSNNLDQLTQSTFDQPLSIFSPKNLNASFQKLFSYMVEKPEKFKPLHASYVKTLNKLWDNTYRNQDKTLPKPLIHQSPSDRRFRDSAWDQDPYFSYLKQSHLLTTQFVEQVLDRIETIEPDTQRRIKFHVRHCVDASAPSNFPMTNPEVLRETLETRGENLIKGFQNMIQDLVDGQGKLHLKMSDPNAFKLGENIAATPGKVVYQNSIFQLIQYLPSTPTVSQVPLLLIPPWINKYYIFDLSPENSFIKWAVNSGMTVFVVSWVNPDERHAEISLQDYIVEGVQEAIDQIITRTRQPQVNTFGYCAGGVALTCLLSHLNQTHQKKIKSATIVATPIDFSKIGDLLVYICKNQVEKLEKHMSNQGFLESNAMVMTFNMLRANDLVWSFYINNYLLGRNPFPFDMLHWNTDAIRMPARMHSDYLNNMFINNCFMNPGTFKVKETPVDISTITTPLFIVGASKDHIASWQSIYPFTQIGPKKNKTFVLSGSGHVAGLVNPAQSDKYCYWTNADLPDSSEAWLENAKKTSGSWWTSWQEWVTPFLGKQSPARRIKKKDVIEDAPGQYAQTCHS